jgi:DNA topoisomerase VI subunit B
LVEREREREREKKRKYIICYVRNMAKILFFLLLVAKIKKEFCIIFTRLPLKLKSQKKRERYVSCSFVQTCCK